MLKLLNSKKAINDVTLMWTIITILFSLGIFVPLIEGYFTGISTEYDIDGVAIDVGAGLPEDDTDESRVDAIKVLASVVSMFFWSFNVHWTINLLLLQPMRIILYILIYRLVRSGGG